MASSFFRQFAIDNSLTVDYGYTFGKYKGFYISIKESIGSSKNLCIITNIGNDKEKLKKVLSCYGDNLAKYCIVDMKAMDRYLTFSFNLSNDKCSLIVEFIDKFIESYINNGLEIETICPICNKKILDGEKMSIIDYQGILTPTHDNCFNTGKEQLKEKVEENLKEINKDRKGYLNGVLGAFVFSLIYVAIMIVAFIFFQFISSNISSDTTYPFADASMGAQIFQYIPSLIAMSASPLISLGYDLFKGKKGTGKFFAVMPFAIVMSIIGTFLGFGIALATVYAGQLSVGTIFKTIFTLLLDSSYKSFRIGFFIYELIAILLSSFSLIFNFTSKKEQADANASTFEKLE